MCIRDRLQTFAFHIVIHLVKAPSIRDFKLLISGFSAILSGILALMISDSGRHSRRYLCRCNLYDAVTEMFLLAGRNSDTDIRQENTVRTQNLAQLLFVHIQWIDLIVVYDWTQTRTGQRILRIRIFALQIINVQCRCQCILVEIRKPQQCRKSDTCLLYTSFIFNDLV